MQSFWVRQESDSGRRHQLLDDIIIIDFVDREIEIVAKYTVGTILYYTNVPMYIVITMRNLTS